MDKEVEAKPIEHIESQQKQVSMKELFYPFKYLLNAYFVTIRVLDSCDTWVGSKKDKNPCSYGGYILLGKIDNKSITIIN